MTVEQPEAAAAPPRMGGGTKNPKKPTRPDFTARDAKLAKLKEKVAEYDSEAKRKASEIESLVNETRANNKLEALKRTLANTVHARTQLEVCSNDTESSGDVVLSSACLQISCTASVRVLQPLCDAPIAKTGCKVRTCSTPTSITG